MVASMSRQAGRPHAAVRIAILALVVLAAPVLPSGSWAGGVGPTWPAATSGPTVLTGSIWFRGRGYGHGVGLSQHGARGRALAGQSYATILAHYFTGTTPGSVDPMRQVRVLVLPAFSPSAADPFVIYGRRGSFTVDGVGGLFPADAAVGLTRESTGWLMTVTATDGTELARKDAVTVFGVRPASDATVLELPPRTSSYDTYRGVLRVRAGSSISVVNEIGLDPYLRGVLPAEMPATWPTEALRAQAIAARGYAVRRLHPTTGTYDLTDDATTQVYQGVEREATATNRAIADTAGIVVKSGSAVANTMFHSTGGAATENNENAFVASSGAKTATPVSYLRGSPDLRPDGTSYDDGSPYAYWKTDTFSVASLSTIFGADPRTSVGTLVSLDLSARGVSGRLVKVVLRGSTGTKTVSGEVFRSAFNANNAAGRPDLRSTLIDLVQAAGPAPASPRPTAVATATATPDSLATATASPTATAAATPTATGKATTPTPTPTPRAVPRPAPKPAPKPTPKAASAPNARPVTTATTSSPGPEATSTPDVAAPAVRTPNASAPPTPILDGIAIVGPGPALAPSDDWMAFSARPPRDRAGSDVYVWRPGMIAPRALTSGGRSLFAGWVGGLVLTSGIVEGDAPPPAGESPELATATSLIDPVSGLVVGDPIDDAWRPSIDPSTRFAVHWEGTVAPRPDGSGWQPARGRLVVARFGLEPVSLPAAIPWSPGRWPSVSPIVSDAVTVADAGVADWEVLWDEGARRVSVWIVDGEGSGRLVSLALSDLPDTAEPDPDIARMRP
jgi:SpoIID/LytB domain protein